MKKKGEAILKFKPPENTKELKSFLGAIQYMAKYLPKFSERTDRLKKLLKKNEQWKWGPEQETDFNRKKNKCLPKVHAWHTTQKKKTI